MTTASLAHPTALTAASKLDAARDAVVQHLQSQGIDLTSSGRQTTLLGVVLGSGLSGLIPEANIRARIAYGDIPHMPTPSVQGHGGHLLIAELPMENGEARTVLVLQGRIHAYEGHAPEQLVFGVRLLAWLGTKTVLLSNAAGSMDADKPPGSVCFMSDHINHAGWNPLVGAFEPRFGPRFPGMSTVYDATLREHALVLAKDFPAMQAKSGVYICVMGPSYETPAEIKAFKRLGANMVGMSTVGEAIALNALGVKVLGLSCMTNYAAGFSAQQLAALEGPSNPATTGDIPATVLTHEEVLEQNAALLPVLQQWFARFCATVTL